MFFIKTTQFLVKLAYKDWLISICIVMLIAWVRATTSHSNFQQKRTLTTNICMLLQSLNVLGFPLCNMYRTQLFDSIFFS